MEIGKRILRGVSGILIGLAPSLGYAQTPSRTDNNVPAVKYSAHLLNNSGRSASAAGDSNIGPQKTVVLLANFSDDTGKLEPLNNQQASDRVFSEEYINDTFPFDKIPDSINAYITEVSYGLAGLVGDVFPIDAENGWYQVPKTQADFCAQGGFFEVRDAAITAANNDLKSDINFSAYTRLFIVFPNPIPDCGSSSTGILEIDIPGVTAELSTSILTGYTNLDNGVGAHEFGHQLELLHAYDLECGENSIGIIDKDCQIRDLKTNFPFLDVFDTMGDPDGKGHFNAIHKEALGWLDSTNILEVNTPGRYFIEPFETIPGPNEIKALKIRLNDTESYYVEYRHPFPNSTDEVMSNLDPAGEIYEGAMLHINYSDPAGIDSLLIDTSPHAHLPGEVFPQYFDSLDAVLRVGMTFEDSINNISITTWSIGDNLTLDIVVPPCPADFNNDGDVGAFDLAQLLGAWGQNKGHPADFNQDGQVDAFDLAMLLGSWGPC